MPWIYLTVAGLLEVLWASAMNKSKGFTLLWPSVVTIAAMIASFTLLALAMKSIPMSISYTIWVGIGAVGAAIVGVTYFHERLTPMQLACMVLIAAGIVGLKVFTPPTPVATDATAPAATETL
jgi:quaternary ammonium compound-resistance protein SugE